MALMRRHAWQRREMECGVRLEPKVPDTSAIGWKIIEAIEAIEAVDREIGHLFGFGEANIHRYPAAFVLFEPQASPCYHAGTIGAEEDFERRVRLACPRIRPGASIDHDPSGLEIIGP